MSSETTSIRIINQFANVAPLYAQLLAHKEWQYGIYPGLLGETHPSWYMHLCGSRGQKDNATYDDVLNATPGLESIAELWNFIKEDLAQGYALTRVYACGHTYGLDGTIHRYAKPSDHEQVALLWLNPEWKDDWAGEIVFYDPSRECVSVRPRPGRLLMFDGAITRVSRAPGRICPTLCMTLSFHLRPLRHQQSCKR